MKSHFNLVDYWKIGSGGEDDYLELQIRLLKVSMYKLCFLIEDKSDCIGVDISPYIELLSLHCFLLRSFSDLKRDINCDNNTD